MRNKSNGHLKNAAAQYALFLAAVFILVSLVFPWGVGFAAFFYFLALQLIIASILTLRRTRLWYAASAMFLGAFGAALYGTMSLLNSRTEFRTLWLWGFFLAVMVLFLVEGKVRPKELQAWKDHQWKCSLIDMLLMRHIPDLRGPRRTSGDGVQPRAPADGRG
jgi:hypothetical protein